MTLSIIIIACILILIAYVFDILAGKINVPSVILLLSLGMLAHELVLLTNVHVPDLSTLLPVFGTVGLILIVLDGALELKVKKSKTALIKKAALSALLPMLAVTLLLALALFLQGQGPFKTCLANAIPLGVISSAVAIPSVRNLTGPKKEFVIYESSLSDILGVLYFNFVALNQEITFQSIEHFGLNLLLIGIVTVLGTLGISWLINQINHPVKHVPVLVLIILVYAVAKKAHMPGLVFVLACGLFLGNVLRFAGLKWVKALDPEKLSQNIGRFREVSVEATFLVRIIFFILFGYLIEPSDIVNTETLPWAFGIVAVIFLIRALVLWSLKTPRIPILWVAPRGLITILLFYSILPEDRIPLVSISLIIQVVLLTALAMMAGLLFYGNNKRMTAPNVIPNMTDNQDLNP